MAPQAQVNGNVFPVAQTMAGTSPSSSSRGVIRRWSPPKPPSASDPVTPSTMTVNAESSPPLKARLRRRIKPSSGRTRQGGCRLCIIITALLGAMLALLAVFRYLSRSDSRQQSRSENLRASWGNQMRYHSTRWDDGLADYEPNEKAVQVILTRFMQHQPDLVTLGMARLKIFETFCFPTVVGQSSKRFLWIIRIDPALNTTLRQGLLDLVNPYPNFVVVASNENPEGFRARSSIGDIVSRDNNASNNNILSGAEQLVWKYHDAAQNMIVLESRLDADDGLHMNYVQYMQEVAPHPALLRDENEKQEPSWNVWCAFSHLEWQYSSPFRGVGDTDEGFLVGIKNMGCITPGLTFVYGRTATRDDLPAGKHTFLHTTVEACKPKKGIVTNCLYKFEELMPGAVRARTPTSAGMANVHISNRHDKHLSKAYKNAGPQAALQGDLWRGVEAVFRIDRNKAIETRAFIAAHLHDIATENLKGQCTSGHSCKHESKEILYDLLQLNNKTNSHSAVD